MSHPVNPQAPLNQQGPQSPTSENSVPADPAQVASILKILHKVRFLFLQSVVLPYNVAPHVTTDPGHVMLFHPC